MQQVAPDLGQHNSEIGREIGFSEEEIAAMRNDGVLFSSRTNE